MSTTSLVTMKALRRDSHKKTVAMVSIPRPQRPEGDRVVIRVVYGGICGTDLTIMEGLLDLPRNLILGHEISGTVEEVGPEVWSVKVGQRVVVSPQTACGQCGNCQKGDVVHCSKEALQSAIGWNQDGGWREFWEVPARQVVVLAEDVPPEMGVLCEPFSCVFQGWERNGPQRLDARVLIMGAGVIGLLWASVFHLFGYGDVTITDPKESRRNLVRNLGLGYRVCDPEALSQEVEGTDMEQEGFSLIIDCSGSVTAIQQALEWLRKGGTLNLFGIPPSEAEVSLRPSLVMVRSITIVGTLVNSQSLPKAMPTFNTLVKKGYLDFSKLGMRIYPFDNYREALEALSNAKVTKAVLEIAK